MSLSQSCSAEANLLRVSPAFSMSLGSKELFHTNFLAFLLEADDPSLQQVQLSIRQALAFSPGVGCVVPCSVWREKSNLDLVVVELRPAGPGDADFEHEAAENQGDASDSGMQEPWWDWDAVSGWQHAKLKGPAAAARGVAGGTAAAAPRLVPSGRVLVVEAKLKSIPRLEQLVAYDDFIAKSGLTLPYPEDGVPSWQLNIQHQPIERCLLTIGGTTLQTPPTAVRAHACLWSGVSWSQLQKAMAGSLATITGSSFHATLTDYVGMLGALVKMARQAVHLCNDAQRARVPYGAMRAQVLDATIKALRLRDLLGKALFDHWLQGYLLPKVAASISPLPAGWRFDSYTHYTRDTPGIGVELINDAFVSHVKGGPPDLRLGIQIQGAEFRLFVSVDRAYPGLEAWIARHRILLNQWHLMPLFHNVSPIGFRGRPVLPPTAKGRATNLKRFGLSRFLYSKCDIDDRPVDEVVDEVARVMAAAQSLLPHL
jgi:hypothetical protein